MPVVDVSETNSIGRLDPQTGAQTTKGNIARIDDDGVIAESKVIKGSEPFGITVDADGDPWYAMMSANRIAELQLR